ncbi:hypothetical protein NECAME_06239 [Necator americanus]|uniref:Uncharacterized protein n=1 Tax=Necator americanus TaxID=51031 RepID=W2TXC7_NECAM|nr:hypothetical protein NECAME_06239 [Necator americanus]ETN85726.1 hypothetical protein NECAME_06239 [Necator americanus]
MVDFPGFLSNDFFSFWFAYNQNVLSTFLIFRLSVRGTISSKYGPQPVFLTITNLQISRLLTSEVLTFTVVVLNELMNPQKSIAWPNGEVPENDKHHFGVYHIPAPEGCTCEGAWSEHYGPPQGEFRLKLTLMAFRLFCLYSINRLFEEKSLTTNTDKDVV